MMGIGQIGPDRVGLKLLDGTVSFPKDIDALQAYRQCPRICSIQYLGVGYEH
jgi:hypothetical protein